MVDALSEALWRLRPAHLAVAFWPDAAQLSTQYTTVLEQNDLSLTLDLIESGAKDE